METARGRGLAKRIAVRMVQDRLPAALPAAGIIRDRALAGNAPSLAIAGSPGFAGYGQCLIARFPAAR